jgi:hypothetical protein
MAGAPITASQFNAAFPKLAADMNWDGALTISDVWLWVKWFYFLPGDFLVQVIGPTPLGAFLEISVLSYHGVGSGIVSAIAWLVVLPTALLLIDTVRRA